MANIADTSRVQLRYIKETTAGVTPSGALTNLRMTGESLNPTKQSIASEEIRSDRQIPDLVQTSRSLSGEVNYELSYGEYDVFMQAALQASAWSGALTSSGSVTYTAATKTFSTTNSFSTIKAGQIVRVVGFTDATVNGYYIAESGTSSTVVVTSKIGGSLPAGNVTDANGKVYTTGMIRNGVTRHSFTLEKQFADVGSVGSNQFLRFVGSEVGGMSLNFEVGAILTGTFNFMGRSFSVGTSTIGTGTAVASQSNDVMNAVNDVAAITFDGTAYAGGVRTITLELDNAMREQQQIGSLDLAGIGSGRMGLQGGLTAYFADNTLLNKFINHNNLSVQFVVEKDDNAYVFTLPRVKVANATVVAGQIDEDVVLEMEYQAIASGSGADSYTIQIDRFTATV